MGARGVLAATVAGAAVGVLAVGAGRLVAGSVLPAVGVTLLVMLVGYVVANVSGARTGRSAGFPFRTRVSAPICRSKGTGRPEHR